MAASYWDSTQRRYWEFTKEQLADLRQRKQDEERSLVQMFPLPEWRHLYIFFNFHLTRLAKRLQIRQQALATAQVYLKRFYCRVEIRRTNPYLAMATALYLACKTEECPQHIRQVAQEAKMLWPDNTHCLEIARVGECEFFMISEMSSQLIVHAPYRTLNTLQLELSLTAEEFIQAWTIVNDHYMTDLPLLYPPHVIAVAAVIWVLVLQAPPGGAVAAGAGAAGMANGSNNSNNASANNHQLGANTMAPSSLNGYNLTSVSSYTTTNNANNNNLGMGMNMNMNMAAMNMGLGGANMSMNMSIANMGLPGMVGGPVAAMPPQSMHMSQLSAANNNNNTPGGHGGHGTPGGVGGPGTPGLGGAAGTPTTAGGAGYPGGMMNMNAGTGGGGSAMAMVQASARAVVSAAMQNGARGGSTAEETAPSAQPPQPQQPPPQPPADGGRGATLQWLFRWLTDSGLDLEATIDCTQEMISFYMAGEEYSEKQTREQVGRMIKARGLDR